jgi:hypothetical protein
MARTTSAVAGSGAGKKKSEKAKKPVKHAAERASASSGKRRRSKIAHEDALPPHSKADTRTESAPGSPSSVFKKGPAAKARIRMYRQGLGDCFLLTLPRAANSQKAGDFHFLFDCGVILGTENKTGRLQQVVADIIRTTGGVVDVLVVTHEHYDHVSGFVLADEFFAKAPPPGQPPEPNKLTVGEVWFGWTEEPADTLARRLQADRDAKKHKLAAMLMGMTTQGMGETRVGQGVGSILSFFGVDFAPEQEQLGMSQALAAKRAPGDPKPKGDTGEAMDFARGLASVQNVHYRRPGEEPWTTPEIDGLRIYVLGPPLAPEMLKKTYASSEVYHLAGETDGLDALYVAALGAAADDADSDEVSAWKDACPFDAAYGHPLPDFSRPNPSRLPAGSTAFLQNHYEGLSDDVLLLDQSWRRIDDDWRTGAAEFALQLDNATNNTSLVLAIECGQTPGAGPVLLFPGDAQVGSWLSWQSVAWPAKSGAPRITGRSLLSRTAFLKVAHHGSENATLRGKGLELMPDADLGGDFSAFIPVDHAMALIKGWDDMPLKSLTEELNRRTGNRLVRVDAPLPAALDGARAADHDFTPPAKGKGPGEDPLYYEFELDLLRRRALVEPAPASAPAAPPGTARRRGRGAAFGFGATAVSVFDQITPERVRHLFPSTPIAPIRENLPHVLDGLRQRGLEDLDMLLMALGTIRAETEGFVPTDEGRSKFNTRTTPFDLYEPGTRVGRNIGNTQPGDGARFKGRGYVQLTGRDNYTRIGPLVSADLVNAPALANRPALAGLILAQFIKNKEAKVRAALAANDLAEARKLVNGGSNGLDRFTDAFQRGRQEFA